MLLNNCHREIDEIRCGPGSSGDQSQASGAGIATLSRSRSRDDEPAAGERQHKSKYPPAVKMLRKPSNTDQC